MSYRILDSEGKIVQQDQLSNNIQLKEDVPPSLYYILIYRSIETDRAETVYRTIT
jgi:hypothetical protein